MNYIKSILSTKKTNTTALIKVKQDIKDLTTNSSIKADLSFNNIEKLKKTLSYQDELKLRQHFYDQLIFKLNTRYKNQPIVDFLAIEISQMAITEISNPDRNISYWQFLTHLAKAVKIAPEKNEDIMAFITGYVYTSSISNPISPKEFLKRRHYTNSVEILTVNPSNKENVGEELETTINQLNYRVQ